jgi:hypothetical protein
VDFKILPLYLGASCEGFLFDGRERIFCNAWDMECMMILPLLGAFQGLSTTKTFAMASSKLQNRFGYSFSG